MSAASTYIPAPLKGLNLIAPPIYSPQLASQGIGMQLDEARVIQNYWVYESGIRQMPDVTELASYSTSNANVYILNPYTSSKMFYATKNKIYRIDSATDSTPTDVTGAATITTDTWNACFFNDYMFLFNGTDAPLQHDFGAGNVAAFSATGPTATDLLQGTGYKSRLYVIEITDTVFWYGGVNAISGTFTSVDLAPVINRPQSNLLCVFNWTANQGAANEELLVFLTNKGEVLVYSGDYPGAANWQLIARSFIPLAASSDLNVSGQPFYFIANDTHLVTQRGVIPMSAILSSREITDGYYNISRRIKNQILAGANNVITVDKIRPFLYARSNTNQAQLYVMNYETGAWSVYAPTLVANELIISSGFFGEYLILGTGNTGATAGRLLYVDVAGGYGSANMTYKWSTPFLELGNGQIVQSTMIRPLTSNFGISSTVKNTVGVGADFAEPATNANDTKSDSVSADTPTLQELITPGIGRALSYVYSRVGVAAINERNEIHGFRAYFDIGGIH